MNRYQRVYVNGVGSTNVAASGFGRIHSINIPIALIGTATFQSTGNVPVTYFVLPIGSKGDVRLDAGFPQGLRVILTAADKLIVNAIINAAVNANVTNQRFVLPRGYAPTDFTNNALYDRNLTQLLTRTYSVVPNQLRIVLYNGRLNNDPSAPGEQFNTNPITCRAAFERISNTVTTKFTFSGSDTVKIQPGEFAISDAWTGTLVANTTYSAHLETVTPGLGMFWPSVPFSGSSTSGRNDQTFSCTATEGANQVYTGGAYSTTGGATNLQGNVSVAYIGTYLNGFATGKAAMLGIGDSIMVGKSSSTLNYFSTNGGGMFERAVRTAQTSYVKYALGSTTSVELIGGSTPLLNELIRYVSQLYWEPGTNDLAGGNPSTVATTVYNAALALNTKLLAANPSADFITMPLIPRTTSTDSWATEGNQTPIANFGNGEARDTLATLYQAGPFQYYDAGVVLQEADNHTLYLTGGAAGTYTADGIHPSDAGHILYGTQLALDTVTRMLK